MQINQIKFEKSKKEAKQYYDNLNSIYCPYLKKEVRFKKKIFYTGNLEND